MASPITAKLEEARAELTTLKQEKYELLSPISSYLSYITPNLSKDSYTMSALKIYACIALAPVYPLVRWADVLQVADCPTTQGQIGELDGKIEAQEKTVEKLTKLEAEMNSIFSKFLTVRDPRS